MEQSRQGPIQAKWNKADRDLLYLNGATVQADGDLFYLNGATVQADLFNLNGTKQTGTYSI